MKKDVKLQKGKTYANKISGLAMKVLSHVHYSSKGFIKFKGCLMDKLNNRIYETKNYKIPSNVPKDFNWKELQDDNN